MAARKRTGTRKKKSKSASTRKKSTRASRVKRKPAARGKVARRAKPKTGKKGAKRKAAPKRGAKRKPTARGAAGGRARKRTTAKAKPKRTGKPARPRQKPTARKPATKAPAGRRVSTSPPVPDVATAASGVGARTAPAAGPPETLSEVGRITHYFAVPHAAVVEVTGEPLAIGDLIRIKGRTTDYTQFVTSMQIEHVPVQNASVGDVIGLEVKDRVREHDTVYKVSRSA